MLLLVLHVIVLVVLIVVNMLACVPTTLRPPMPTKLVEFCHKSGQVSDDMWLWKVVIEAVDPSTTHLTSLLYIYNVFDNLYMLWMCIWMCPHHVTAALFDRACGILSQIWASLSWYVMVKWGDWGYGPNPYSSHIHIIYIKGVWQSLYAVDVHMDVSTPPYGRSCRPSFWNFATNVGKSQLICDGEMRWLRL